MPRLGPEGPCAGTSRWRHSHIASSFATMLESALQGPYAECAAADAWSSDAAYDLMSSTVTARDGFSFEDGVERAMTRNELHTRSCRQVMATLQALYHLFSPPSWNDSDIQAQHSVKRWVASYVLGDESGHLLDLTLHRILREAPTANKSRLETTPARRAHVVSSTTARASKTSLHKHCFSTLTLLFPILVAYFTSDPRSSVRVAAACALPWRSWSCCKRDSSARGTHPPAAPAFACKGYAKRVVR